MKRDDGVKCRNKQLEVGGFGLWGEAGRVLLLFLGFCFLAFHCELSHKDAQ
jgi:hypothetical protein